MFSSAFRTTKITFVCNWWRISPFLPFVQWSCRRAWCCTAFLFRLCIRVGSSLGLLHIIWFRSCASPYKRVFVEIFFVICHLEFSLRLSLLFTHRWLSRHISPSQCGNGAGCIESSWKQDFFLNWYWFKLWQFQWVQMKKFLTTSLRSHFTGWIRGWSISRRTHKTLVSCKWDYSKSSTILWWDNFLLQVRQLIEVWLGLTVLDASKQGPALKNRLHGNAEQYKPLLNRDTLKADDGVKYFRDMLRPHFVKGAHSIFFWIFRARRINIEIVDWMGRFDLLLRRLKDSWMDMLPLSSMTEQQKEAQYQAHIAQ